MFQKKKKKPLVLILIVVISFVLAILGAVVLPVPEKYKQLVFWGLLALISIIAGAILKTNGKRRM